MWRSEQHCICCGGGRETSRSISDLKVCPVGLVCGGASSIVFVVEEAGDVGEVTFLAWNPEVTGASIEDDLEGLWWSSNGDGTIVLGVHVVGERLRLEASILITPSAPQQVEGGVDLFKVSSGSLVFDQWDSHHLGERTRLVVVEIVVSRETYRSLANNQERNQKNPRPHCRSEW